MDKIRLLKAGIDYDEGLDRCMGNNVLYNKLLLRLIENSNYDNLLEAIKEKNYEKAFGFAHTLKGMLGNLSVNEAYSKIVLLVEDLRNKMYKNIDKLFEDFNKKYLESVKAIKEII